MSCKISQLVSLFFFFSMASTTLLDLDVSPFLYLFGDSPVLNIPFFMNLYKNNTFERLMSCVTVPPSMDPQNGVKSKDIVIATNPGVSARLFIMENTDPAKKLPLLVYFHGGGFSCGSAFEPQIHDYLISVVAAAKVVAVSVNYRLAPENPIPDAYEDAWNALNWVAAQSMGEGNEAWVKDYADFQRVFVGGDSAGANIAHNVAMRAGRESLGGVKLAGMVLLSPYFWGTQPIGEHESRDVSIRKNVENMWLIACRMSIGLDEPQVNPIVDPRLSSLGCTRVLVSIAEKDWLRDRGEYYAKALRESGWKGEVEVTEAKGKTHVFQFGEPKSEEAVAMFNKVVSFLNNA